MERCMFLLLLITFKVIRHGMEWNHIKERRKFTASSTWSPSVSIFLKMKSVVLRGSASSCCSSPLFGSIVVIMLLLQRTLKPHGPPLWAMQTAVLLDLLGLLGAYAAGSCRDWETSIYVITLVAVVVLFIALHVLLSFDVVFKKAKKLMPNKCFEVDDKQ